MFSFLFMTSSLILRSNIVAQSFVGFQARIRVLRALDRVSSASVSKMMPKNSKYFRNFLWGLGDFPE